MTSRVAVDQLHYRQSSRQCYLKGRDQTHQAVPRPSFWAVFLKEQNWYLIRIKQVQFTQALGLSEWLRHERWLLCFVFFGKQMRMHDRSPLLSRCNLSPLDHTAWTRLHRGWETQIKHVNSFFLHVTIRDAGISHEKAIKIKEKILPFQADPNAWEDDEWTYTLSSPIYVL